METKVDHSSVQPETSGHRSMRKHIISYVIMMVISIAAFLMVAYEVFSPVALTVALVIMASVLVFLQLADFMHLDQKGHQFPVIFISNGLFWGIIFILVIIIWP
jgi:cytochrome c oxidase subunit 4